MTKIINGASYIPSTHSKNSIALHSDEFVPNEQRLAQRFLHHSVFMHIHPAFLGQHEQEHRLRQRSLVDRFVVTPCLYSYALTDDDTADTMGYYENDNDTIVIWRRRKVRKKVGNDASLIHWRLAFKRVSDTELCKVPYQLSVPLKKLDKGVKLATLAPSCLV